LRLRRKIIESGKEQEIVAAAVSPGLFRCSRRIYNKQRWRLTMNERTLKAVASLKEFSAEEKDEVLAELLQDKWRREGGEPTFVIRKDGRTDAGFCVVL